ncbi:zinc finger protein 654-like, partial [Vombatus ursinus]|uniref:zinc finger protein 654-like n=1 Tax=Vombatus ursinus TaxID=29139 RepID=UPI000FFD730E
KFRNRGLMLKHLKNHVKKIQRQHFAVVQQEDQGIPTTEQINCSNASISFENGNSDIKDNEVETPVAYNSEKREEETFEQVAEVTKNIVCEPHDVIKNGSPDSSLNNAPEPLTTESLPRCIDDDDLNRETPVLHKINGTVCPQKDLDIVDQQENFKCPANGCVRIFKKIRFLNKHARKAHPTDLKVQQHIMKWNKGKCRFCQRKFEDSQHFIDHLKRHIYPNVYFCLHFTCNQRFKLSTELAEHTKSHSVFQAQCNFPECHELFEELPLLYEHEAQHYLNLTPEPSAETSRHVLDTLTELQCESQEKDLSGSEKETVDLPVPTWKSRKDSTEPKTYIQSVEKKTNSVVQNGNDHSSDVTASAISFIDQKMTVVEPNSEKSSVISDQLLVNGHSESEQTSLVSSDVALKIETSGTRTENGSISQNVEVVPQEHSPLIVVSQSPSKPNPPTENTSYGLILTKPYVRPLPPSYLDERYISMPKRRKTLTDKVDAHSDQDSVYSTSSERFRCGNCLTIYCNSEALEAHLAQKKCQTLFGFDSDDESA